MAANSYGYTLPAGKTLESITLPHNASVRILGAVLSEPTAVDLSWNAYGIVVGNNQVPNSQGFDGDGNYYNAYSGNVVSDALGRLASSNSNFDYMQISWGGATFNLGPAPNHYSQSNNRNGNDNVLQARGQTISVPAGDFSQLLLIGAAAGGNQSGTITFHFAGESSGIPWTQTFTDWRNSSSTNNPPPSGSALGASGESLVAVTNVVNQVGNQQTNENAFVYGYSFDLTPYAGMTLESITLPNNSHVGILGMALV